MGCVAYEVNMGLVRGLERPTETRNVPTARGMYEPPEKWFSAAGSSDASRQQHY